MKKAVTGALEATALPTASLRIDSAPSREQIMEVVKKGYEYMKTGPHLERGECWWLGAGMNSPQGWSRNLDVGILLDLALENPKFSHQFEELLGTNWMEERKEKIFFHRLEHEPLEDGRYLVVQAIQNNPQNQLKLLKVIDSDFPVYSGLFYLQDYHFVNCYCRGDGGDWEEPMSKTVAGILGIRSYTRRQKGYIDYKYSRVYTSGAVKKALKKVESMQKTQAV